MLRSGAEALHAPEAERYARRRAAVSREVDADVPLLVDAEFLAAAAAAALAVHVAVLPDALLAVAVAVIAAAALLPLVWRFPALDAPFAAVYAVSAGALAYAAPAEGDPVAGCIAAVLVGGARLGIGRMRRRKRANSDFNDPYL